MAADPGSRAATPPGSGLSASEAASPGGAVGPSAPVAASLGEAIGASLPDAASPDPWAVLGPAGGVLVVGYGNPLRSDDGVGPVVAERLASDPRFAGAEVRAEHQLTPELALDVSRSWLVVLVDAAEGIAAGEVVIRELGPAGGAPGADGGQAGRIEEGGPPLTHHVDPSALLGLAAELWGANPRTVLVGIGPASLDLGDELTSEVEAAVPRAIDAIAEAMAGLRDAPPVSRAGER